MNSKKWMILGLLSILAGILLAGCGAATPEGPAFPVGKFMNEADQYRGYVFTAENTWQYLDYGEIGAEGKFNVKGNLWTEEGTEECPFPGTYEWTFDGTNLSFKLVGEDNCEPRREATDGQTFVLANTQQVSIPEIAVEAADFSYKIPDSVSAGWVRVKLTNSGAEPHHVQFMLLNEGVTVEQFKEALMQGEGPAMALVKQVGGVGTIVPGGTAQSVLNLPTGEYVILCFVPSPSDHVPHLAKGMVASFTVNASGSGAGSEPKASVTVTMKDFMFDAPERLSTGKLVVKVINDGPEAHEINIMRLADGKTLDDVTAYMKSPDGPPPFIPMGGMNGLDAGLTAYMELDLAPGNYVAICNIPSPKANGAPHHSLGMIKVFTVQ